MKKHYLLLLIITIVLTGFFALNAHVLIFQHFNPPVLHLNPKINNVFFYIQCFLSVTGAVIIYLLSRKSWDSLNLFYKVILFAMLILALTEQLFRGPFMGMVVGMPWTYQVLTAIPPYVGCFVLSLLIFLCVPIISRINNFIFLKYIAFVSLTTVIVFFIKKITTNFLLPLFAYIPQIDQSKGIQPPYGMNVLIPAYITFLEPTIACFILFYLFKDKLLEFNALVKGFIIGGILILIHGGLYSTVQIFSSQGNILYRVFYYGQFVWEYLGLGILTAYSFVFLEKIKRESKIIFVTECN